MTRDRLLFIARCVDTALFVVGLAYVPIMGWPTTVWGWFCFAGLTLPLITSVVWVEVKAHRAAAAARKTLAYRRAKFGGYVATRPGRQPIPLDRPTPWTDR